LFLKNCKLVFARGEKTFAHLKELDHEGQWVDRADDVAFCYSDQYSLSTENESYIEEKLRGSLMTLKQSGSVIGICPSSLVASKGFDHDTSPYIDQIEATVRSLLDDGKNVLLFPNATRADSNKFRNNDIKIIRILTQRLGANAVGRGRLEVIDKDINTKSIRAIIQLCDLVIVSRFHAMVAALALGVPCVVLGWSHKYFEVMKSFGMQDYVFAYNDFDAKKVGQLVTELLGRKADLSGAILSAGEAAKQRSRHQFDMVAQCLSHS
jgi:polysaccharide pyruvyl transferase WcaK-like protein